MSSDSSRLPDGYARALHDVIILLESQIDSSGPEGVHGYLEAIADIQNFLNGGAA